MAAQYETITLSVNDLDRIKLPKFQRGFVWTKKKKTEFVQTLHEGFPFGALLVYPESEETGSDLLLLDGQQRLSTIKEFKEKPLLFWKPLNKERYDQLHFAMNELLDEVDQLQERDFDELITKSGDEVADWADRIDDREKRRTAREIVSRVKDEIRQFVDLDSLQILAIKFIGQKDRIAEVFSNLNKGGIPLSKYEIYSAAWVHTEIPLLSADQSALQEEILGNVKKYYEKMEREVEFDLDGFSQDELSLKRVITLSELGIGLGMYVQKHLNALVPRTSGSAAEIGFGILGIASNVDNRRLDTLNESLPDIRKNLQVILEKTERICSNLQDIFSKLLKQFKAEKSDVYVTGLSTTFKTLSYFAALWDLDPASEQYQTSLKNVRSYYVYDSLLKVWSSHGDQRLLDFYPSSNRRNYLSPVDDQQFLEAFSQWLGDATPGIQFGKETKALVTIHANLGYLSSVVPYGESFELEHIIAKKKINESDDLGSRKILGSSIGNCMYLPHLDNNKKKEKTLYEVNADGRYDDLIRRSQYFSKETLAAIEIALAEKNYAEVNRYIQGRARAVCEAMVAMLNN